MKDLYQRLAECVGEMTESQRSAFHAKHRTSMSIEAQVNLAESILKPVRRNNGAVESFTESAQFTTEIDGYKKRQYEAYRKAGFTEAEAKIAAGYQDAQLELARKRGDPNLLLTIKEEYRR